MAPAKSLLLLCIMMFGAVLSLVNGQRYSGQGQGQGHDPAQGQGGGNFLGGQQGGYGGDNGRSSAGGRGGGARGYGDPDEDARQYNFRIFNEPEYYGYESKIPGGKAMFKSYRSSSSGFGRQGADAGGYNSGGRGGRSFEGGYGTGGNFGARGGGHQPQY